MRTTIKHFTPNGQLPCPPDNTSRHIEDALDQWRGCARGDRRVVHAQVAMEIAAWWAGPGQHDMPFTRFSGEGWITDDLLSEIDREIRGAIMIAHTMYWKETGDGGSEWADAFNALHALREYIVAATR